MSRKCFGSKRADGIPLLIFEKTCQCVPVKIELSVDGRGMSFDDELALRSGCYVDFAAGGSGGGIDGVQLGIRQLHRLAQHVAYEQQRIANGRPHCYCARS